MYVRNLKDKMLAVFIIFAIVIFMLPSVVLAKEIKPNSIDELEESIKNAEDGDTIDLVNLFSKKGFNSSDGNKRYIDIDKNITLTSKDPDDSYYNLEHVNAVAIDNISFNIKEGKTLILTGHLYLRGVDDRAVFTGDGNLVVTDRGHIEGKNANPAIFMSYGSVTIKNLVSYKGEEKTDKLNNYGYPIYKYHDYKSEILGGNSNDNGASAIVAKDINIIQDNLKESKYKTLSGLFIQGGHALNENSKGGYALDGENIVVDLSGEYNKYASEKNIVGGSGGYGAGAIRGTNINILCAGNQNIIPGNGINLNGIDEESKFYHGVIEVKDGGHLTFGTKEGLTDPAKLNAIEGFDGKSIQYAGDKDVQNFFKGRNNWSNFYGPSIWAKGNARVDIKVGKFYGIGGNMRGNKKDPDFMKKLPLEPIIKMDTGVLNIGEENQIKGIDIGGGFYSFNSPKTMISSNGDINVYGSETKIVGPSFTSVNDRTGYIKNAIALKTGASAIESKGQVLVDGANIIGGTLGNINTDDEQKRNEYRQGSGIVGAKKVIIQNRAIVQGRGAFEYNKDGFRSYATNLYNVSAGHGLENVGEVIVDNAEVHGGDISTTPANCSDKNVCCTGSGKAGSAIKGAYNVEIRGTSLVTGGSSTNNVYNILFADRLPAGHGIDGYGSNDKKITRDVIISGDAQIYGGGSSTRSGHAIANAENVTVTGDNSNNSPTIFGGGCRYTKDTGKEIAGSGLFNVDNATVEAGKIESGNKLYQIYVDKYKDKMHPKTKTGGFVGTSKDASAIVANKKVIIDGKKDYTPEIRSYYIEKGWLLKTKYPVASVNLKNEGSLYVGDANVFSGLDQDHDKNILVKGGKYHVDIFKDNNINSYKEVDNESIIYNSEDSKGLYRILEKDEKGYVDVSEFDLTNSKAYDDVFYRDYGIHLYQENGDLKKNLEEKAAVRKANDQHKAIKEVEHEEEIKNMPSDNIIIGKTFSVIYDANLPVDADIDISGDVPIDSNKYTKGDSAIVLGIGNLSLKNYTFMGWNTEVNGEGITYKAQDKLTINSNIKLYAIWQAKENTDDNKEETFDLKVEKIWKNMPKRTYPVKVDLYSNGEKLEGHRLELNEENNWSATFKNLIKDRDYTVREVGEVDGKITIDEKDSFKVEVSDILDKTVTVTNTYIDEADSGNIIPISYTPLPKESEQKIETHLAYIYGYPDLNIRPQGNITRAEAAALVIRLADLRADDNTNRFVDTDEGAWYNPYINRAYSDEMLLADGKRIMPDQNITRAEFAKLIYILDDDKYRDLPFTDTKGHIFEREIERAYANRRIEGYPDNSFRPDAEITRAEAVKILNSLFDRVPDKDYIDENEMDLNKFSDLNKSYWYYYELMEASNSHKYLRKENGLDELWKDIFKNLNN